MLPAGQADVLQADLGPLNGDQAAAAARAPVHGYHPNSSARMMSTMSSPAGDQPTYP
jgi:hypothetical protein